MATDDGLLLTLSKRGLAEQLGISVRTLERLRKLGVLPPPLPGFGQPRWATSAVKEWLAARSKA